MNAAQLSKGELAALVFERLEQRHSLAEIVIALRVPPEDVRDLYHTWLVGLWSGELQRPEPALPPLHDPRDVVRRVTPVQLSQLLMSLPEKQSTRLSVARIQGEFMNPRRAQRERLRRVSQPHRAGRLHRLRPGRARRHRGSCRGRRVPCKRVRLQSAGPALGGARALGRGGELDGDNSKGDKQVDARGGSTSNRASAACAIA